MTLPILVPLLIVWSAASVAAVPAEPAAWLDELPANYGPIAGDLRERIELVAEAGIPVVSLVQLMREGVAKRVAPSRLLAAVDAELERIVWLGALLAEHSYHDPERPVAADALTRLSVYLQSGVYHDAVEELLKNRPPLAQVLSAGEALSRIAQFIDTGAQDQLALSRVLMDSSLPPSRYPALSSAVLRGLSAGISSARMLDIIVEVLSSGGGMLQIDQEIRSHGRGR